MGKSSAEFVSTHVLVVHNDARRSAVKHQPIVQIVVSNFSIIQQSVRCLYWLGIGPGQQRRGIWFPKGAAVFIFAAVATLAPGTSQPPIHRVPLVLRGKVIAGEAGHSVYSMTIKNIRNYYSTPLVIPCMIKAIPGQAWTGPEDSRNPRPSGFDKVR